MVDGWHVGVLRAEKPFDFTCAQVRITAQDTDIAGAQRPNLSEGPHMAIIYHIYCGFTWIRVTHMH